MKKVLNVMFAIATILLICCSCGTDDIFEQYMDSTFHSVQATRTPTAQKKYIVGYVCQDFSTPFIVSVRDEILKAFKASGMNVEVIIYDGEASVEKQLSQIELLISQRVNLIILNAISFTSCDTAVETATANNIPVVTVVSRISNQDECSAFVGPDQYTAGAEQARLLMETIGGQGNIMVLKSQPQAANLMQLDQAYQDIMGEYPGVNIQDSQSAHNSEAEAYVIARNWFRQPDIEIHGILAQNGGMALGAYKAARENGKTHIPIAGLYGDSDAIEAVEDGRLSALVHIDPSALAAELVACVENLLSGRPVEREYIVPYTVYR